VSLYEEGRTGRPREFGVRGGEIHPQPKNAKDDQQPTRSREEEAKEGLPCTGGDQSVALPTP